MLSCGKNFQMKGLLILYSIRYVNMISVVMATYNGEKFIEKQMLSILNQTKKPDEVLIADDCSKDNTAKIIKDFIEKNKLSNWNFKINLSNQGYQKNFYNLLKESHGDIIFLADQDDYWHKEKIEIMSDIMEKNKSIQALCSTVNLVDANSNKIEVPKIENLYNSNFTFSKEPLRDINFFDITSIMSSNISPGCSMCITGKLNKQFLETYNFTMPHDWHMNLIASLFNGCCLINRDLIDYRLHGNNTIGATTGAGIREALKKFQRKEKIIEFTGRLDTFSILEKYFSINSSQIDYVKAYTKARLNFYKHPNLWTLKKLRSYKEYWMTSKKRGQMFDMLVAIHLDWILYLIYGESRE